ncbi:uncharacterized protein LOC127715580 isoform X1 [Mytilus californianus]|uniref:uncharacterized protein LOC127715580 isoform X1 n=1 Tax=Mytilus californianus TaxID=6549 RepID=UPI0022469F69|nr:uncharacterized protein LOC127715580 isoform X1 [Mytilus californianus]
MCNKRINEGESMAIIKTFLCFSNTRVGTLICGCYTLIVSLVCLVFYLFRYVGYQLIQDSPEYKGIVYAGFVLYGLMITTSLVLIPGVQLDKRYLLLPWIYMLILNVLYETGSVALLTTVHMEREKTLHAWEIIWVFFYCFKLIANCYCFACVVSQYQELSEGRGTYEYLYKPRTHRSHRCRQDFSVETFELPFGYHLPPYTESDPNKELNPPNYEQIYPQPKEEPISNHSHTFNVQSSNNNCYQVTVDIVWI